MNGGAWAGSDTPSSPGESELGSEFASTTAGVGSMQPSLPPPWGIDGDTVDLPVPGFSIDMRPSNFCSICAVRDLDTRFVTRLRTAAGGRHSLLSRWHLYTSTAYVSKLLTCVTNPPATWIDYRGNSLPLTAPTTSPSHASTFCTRAILARATVWRWNSVIRRAGGKR